MALTLREMDRVTATLGRIFGFEPSTSRRAAFDLGSMSAVSASPSRGAASDDNLRAATRQFKSHCASEASPGACHDCNFAR